MLLFQLLQTFRVPGVNTIHRVFIIPLPHLNLFLPFLLLVCLSSIGKEETKEDGADSNATSYAQSNEGGIGLF